MINSDFELPGGKPSDSEIKSGIEGIEKGEQGKKVLNKFIQETIVENQEPDFPLTEGGCIDMGKFKEQEEDFLKKKAIEVDCKKAFKIEEGFYYKKAKRSELSERLSMAIIHKIIGNDFFISRSSLYDDLVNRADIIITRRGDKEPICVLDIKLFREKDERTQWEIDEQTKIIHKLNLSRQGTKLNFYRLDNRKIDSVPIFCIPLETKMMLNCLDNFTPSLSEKELEVFDNLITSIEDQIAKLEKEDQFSSSLFPLDFKKQIYNLEWQLKEWKERSRRERKRLQRKKRVYKKNWNWLEKAN